jgi:hypothetical protein
MIISDLEVLEIVRDENVEGGSAFADSYANARAKGKKFASTYTSTYAEVKSFYGYKEAKSGSFSSAVAD